MAVRNLTMDGFIGQDIKNGQRYCFILGAGASRSSGIKTGKELVDIWDEELRIRTPEEYLKWRTEFNITDENKYNHYGEYYAKRYERDHPRFHQNQKHYRREGQEYLERMMENARPQIGYLLLAMIMEHNNHNNVVITTNFDHLIEDSVIRYCKKTPLVIGHETLARYVSPKLHRPLILKIHRDLLMEPINTPGSLEKLQPQWNEALDAIFSEYHPIFIGYAGNDRSVMTFLTENADKFASGEWQYPYWTVYQQEEPEEQVRKFLDASEAWLIRNNGFDDMMIRIGQALDCKIPPKEEFVERIERQYDDWMDTAVVEQTVPEEQESADTLYFDALMKYKVGQYQQALPELQKAVQMEPKNARYRHGLAVTLCSLGNYKEALQESRKTIELEPENADYHHGLAATLYFQGRSEEALLESQKATELAPDNAKYHRGQAEILHAMGQYIEALYERRKAVALEPDNAKYHHGLAITLYSLGYYYESEMEIRKALELDPDRACYHFGLSSTLFKQDRREESLLERRIAVKLNPDNSEYHRAFAVLLLLTGHCVEAVAEFRKAKKLAKN